MTAELEARVSRRPAPEEYFSIPEAAAAVRISEKTLRQIIAQGCGPRVSVVGRQKRIRSDHLAAWQEMIAA